MPKPSSEWVEHRTLGAQARRFWWRVAPDGGLSILRVLGKRGQRRQVVRAFSRDQVAKLLDFMADGAWHPLASNPRDLKKPAKRHGVGAFLHQQLGCAPTHAICASHIAAVLSHAGLWQWDGRAIGMRLRQLHADPARLAAAYAAQQAGHPGTPPEPARRQQPKSPAVLPPGYRQAASFRGRAAELRGRLESVDSGRHGAGKGHRRETVIRDFIRRHLAARYGIGAGEVAEPTGEISRQVDILIYDALDTEPLEPDPHAMVLAAESIYAAIEIKPILDAAFLTEAYHAIRSVKSLPRTALDRPLLPDGRPRPPRENPSPFGAVIGRGGSDPERLLARLHELQHDAPPTLWLDAICILDRAVIHRRGEIPGPAGWTPALSTLAVPYAVADVGPDALFYFLTLLRLDLRRKRLWPYDPVAYAVG